MIEAQLSGDKISSNSAESFNLNDKSSYGEKKKSKVEYSLIEALFLVSEKKMKIAVKNKEFNEEDLLKKAIKIDKKIETKIAVFSDLRNKGYIVKTALKYGADFRVYDKGVKPGENHARWIVYTTKETENLTWQDFAAKNRIAHSTKKNLIIAIVDEESDVSYYEVSWIRP